MASSSHANAAALARPQVAPVSQLGRSVSRHDVQPLWRAGSARRQPPPQRQQQQRQQQWQQQRRPSALPADDSIEASGEFCMPAFVTADNTRSKTYTVLDVEVADYPGLMRVLAWTLNGLDVVAQNAVLRTSEAGMAHNTFWLTSRGGTKLRDSEAELLAERVRDFVMFCSPAESDAARTEFCAGPVHISNTQHPQCTVVTVVEPRPTPGFLLEVASALSALNIQIQQGVVQGPTSFVEGDEADVVEQLDVAECLASEGGSGRTFKFWVRSSAGGDKLDYPAISALLYVLNNILGFRSQPTLPPLKEMLLP